MLKLKTEKRKLSGRKVKSLRREGILPANIYGKGLKSQSVQVSTAEFSKVFKEAGETGLVELSLGKEKRPVLVHNVHYDPVSDEPLHADFHQVNLKEKTTASVPIEITGDAPAEKRGEGTLVQYIDEVQVEALPTDLPERFEVDASSLEEVNSSLQVKDLPYDKDKVKLEIEAEELLAKVEPLRKEEEVAPPPPAEGEEEEGEESKETEAKEEEAKEGEEKPQEKGEKPQEDKAKPEKKGEESN